jgi:hypothetical protein
MYCHTFTDIYYKEIGEEHQQRNRQNIRK